VPWGLWEVGVLLVAMAAADYARSACLPYMLTSSSPPLPPVAPNSDSEVSPASATSAGICLSLLAADFYSVIAGVVFLKYKVRKDSRPAENHSEYAVISGPKISARKETHPFSPDDDDSLMEKGHQFFWKE